MKLTLTIDRFEDDLAVLLADDDASINWPRALLPEGAKAGDRLTVTLERDTVATRRIADATKTVQEQLSKTDAGGDIKL